MSGRKVERLRARGRVRGNTVTELRDFLVLELQTLCPGVKSKRLVSCYGTPSGQLWSISAHPHTYAHATCTGTHDRSCDSLPFTFHCVAKEALLAWYRGLFSLTLLVLPTWECESPLYARRRCVTRQTMRRSIKVVINTGEERLLEEFDMLLLFLWEKLQLLRVQCCLKSFLTIVHLVINYTNIIRFKES